MEKNLLIFLFSILTTTACITSKNQTATATMQQGIEGFVYRISGNQMPYPNMPAQTPNGFSTTIYIYETTNIKDVARKGSSAFYFAINKKQIATVQSDSTGHFAIALPTGSYSLFTKVDNLFYANSFDIENNIALVKVDAGKITQTVIKVDAGATY